MKRIEKEKEIVKLMIEIFCSKKHKTHNLCPECRELLHYAHKRLSACKYQEKKVSCRKCPVHCYKEDMKIKIRKVMRYSGPKILFYRPYEAIRHIFR